MSGLLVTSFVRRVSHFIVLILTFGTIIGLFAAPKTARSADFAGTNLPTDSVQDLDLFPDSDSNQPPALVTNSTTDPSSAQVSLTSPQASPAILHPPASATNASQDLAEVQSNPMDDYVQKLETARYLRKIRQQSEAGKELVALLGNDVPDPIQRSALLELAALAQDQDDLPRTQDIYAQFLNRWPDDPRIPEVLLRQGKVFRDMGLHNLALTKFYAVMTAALTLKNDRLDYYQQLVAEAQTEIAETHYALGEYSEAADYFSRLFKQDNPNIDRQQVLYKLVRCYSSTTNYDEAIACGQNYLAAYPETVETAEVRYDLALTLKQVGRDTESLQQVLALLREQSLQARSHPETWAYWQQRTGNLIANQFYREGDYERALDIYTSLAQLDPSPQWQLPVWYQIGLTYEHLWQPQKATEIYNQIATRESELSTNDAPSLRSIIDMARWRVGFIHWQNNAQAANQSLQATNPVPPSASPAPLPPAASTVPQAQSQKPEIKTPPSA